MENFTIDNFWRNRLPLSKPSNYQDLQGWEIDVPALNTFVEAPLTHSDNFGNDDNPITSEVILVSAAGAVGKSTLARQIASLTGAVYLDLAQAEPVGGNTLSGGLVKSGTLSDWQAGTAALLVDGLDEARLKVTQEGFEAFLGDIAFLCKNRKIPTVLFGRTGAVQDAWIILSGRVAVTVLEIGYYPPQVALEFAKSQLLRATPNNQHIDICYKALSVLIDRLRQDTQIDGDRFAGYAPVLQAVADRVSREKNPSALISQVEKGEQPVTLQTVVDAILEREQQKLQTITFEDTNLPSVLYTPKEQLDRLIAQVYKKPPPPLPIMSSKDTQTYSSALSTWVPEHPFLDGNSGAASAVFEAVITGAALRNSATADSASKIELSKGASANPFLAEFYFGDNPQNSIPPEHIGVYYASLRARLSQGDSASLSVDGAEDGDDVEQLKCEVEISLVRFGEDNSREKRFESDQAGTIRLGSHIEDVEITAPFSKVEIIGTRESVLVAPVSIQCQTIKFSTERIIIEKSPSMKNSGVLLEAENADATSVINVPLVNDDVEFSVVWQGAEAYPWTNFRGSPTFVTDPRLDEALRRFRKFVISFRSHSKGSLKRYAAKLEHARMTKGTGRAVLNHMLKNKILSTNGSMYTLDPDALAEHADASYTSVMSRAFSKKTIAFVEDAITTAE